LANVAFAILTKGLSFLAKSDDSPFGLALNSSLRLSLLILIACWLLVGIWRAAGKHPARGGRRSWAVIARFTVVVGSICLGGRFFQHAAPRLMDMWSIALGDPSVGEHRLNILVSGTELQFAGGITVGVTDEARKLLDADRFIRVIRLKSDGGRVGEAIKLSDLIHERELVTYVTSTCASACTEAFMGGVQRYIAPDAKLGFHQVKIEGATDSELAQANAIGRQLLIAHGVAEWFADRAFSTLSSSMWWPTIDDLTRAGVITGVVRPDDFALSARPFFPFDGRGQAATPEDVDRELQKTSLYLTIKRVDPEVYRRMLLAIRDAIKFGKTRAQLTPLLKFEWVG
jgi:hypothetical protein